MSSESDVTLNHINVFGDCLQVHLYKTQLYIKNTIFLLNSQVSVNAVISVKVQTN